MRSSKLQGLSILVTRPGEAGVALCNTLEKAGASVSLFPTIAFADPPSLSALIEGLSTLTEQDWIFFVSPQAVERFITYTDQYHLDRRLLSARIAAIGDGTARVLEQAGMTPIVYPTENATSEGLLLLPEVSDMANKKVTIVKGVGGRTLLADELRVRGAQVQSLIVYQRVLPKIDAAALKIALNQKKIHVILSTSFDSVSHLCQLVGEASGVQRVPLVVMSERVRQLARALGFVTVYTNNVADQVEIEQFLIENKDQLCQMNNNKL